MNLVDTVKLQNTVKVRLNARKLQNNFAGFSQIGSVFYPMKTESNETLLRELVPMLNKDGHGFAIKTLSHFDKLRKLGVGAERVGLLDVRADDVFVEYLYGEGVRNFTFDNIGDVKKLATYADLGKCKIHNRLNVGGSHLGASVDELHDMIDFERQNNCTDYGISFYAQKEFSSAVDKVLDAYHTVRQNFDVNFINLGGSKTAQELANMGLGKDIPYIVEPGRYLVGDTMDMVTNIVAVKNWQGRQIVVLRNGIYSGLLDEKLYGRKFNYAIEDRDGWQTDIAREPCRYRTHEFTMCGGSSDVGDSMGVCYVDEPCASILLKAGTNVIVKNVGAYCMEFNSPLGGDIQFEVEKI